MKNQSNNALKKKQTKKNNELKSVEVNVVINFIKDKIENFSDAKVCSDDDVDDSEEDRITEFR